MSRDNWDKALNTINIPLHYIRCYNPFIRELKGISVCEKGLLNQHLSLAEQFYRLSLIFSKVQI